MWKPVLSITERVICDTARYKKALRFPSLHLCENGKNDRQIQNLYNINFEL